ncbi:transporter [Mucilaginibacter sp. SMC90]|uniref:transporter n=1 Tax=Mucilaginibacter sp. SMC90 TaxID=2929803 RepID=UPI001FB35C71|nr:transporter [Mucilaginibacter sp. SMC90]UOE51919.1 transporter [Mucilaginibacter sp. SMC90]
MSLYFYRCCIVVSFLLAVTQCAKAQTDADALMIPKNYFCAAAVYSHGSWDHYWEGTFKRDNQNLGTVSTNVYSLGGNYGLSNRINLLFMVPYVTTNASAGTLRGEKSFQDLSVSFKWMAVKEEIGSGLFSVHAIATGVLPLANYQADFLPLSVGLHSKSAALRALLNYQTGRFFVAGSGQYIRRDNITIDRTSYYTTEMHYTNEVQLPNATNFMFSSGYRSLKFNAEATFTKITSTSGFDIRKNDMPFPSNRMNSTAVGLILKYSFQSVSGLEFTAGGNYVLDGRNVGQTRSAYAGVYYVFSTKKEK